MGDSRFARCLQGGGVYVLYGTVSIVNSQIYSNTAFYVRADVRNFEILGDSRFAPCLQGGGVYVDGGTVSIVNSQIYSNTAADVRARVRNVPSPPWETHNCLLFAGRRYLCLFRHGHDNVFLDLREYS